LTTGTLVALAPGFQVHAQQAKPSDPIVDVLIEKGIINQAEAEKITAELAARQTNAASATPASSSKWKISDAIKGIQLFGDARLRYEYRGVDNAPGAIPDTYYRERFRYAVRFGVKGDLYENFNYGLRLETSTNPRSPWVTFGNNTSGGSVTPSDKAQSGIGIGQVYLGWHPSDWYEMTVGRMPMPLYTTPMVWDSDINPEGAFEKFKYTSGKVDWFADFAQFDYQNPTSASAIPSSDTFILAWQAGATVNLSKNLSFKVAPALYNYTGSGSGSGLNLPYTGEGKDGMNVNYTGNPAYNQNGINDLLVFEVPAEFNFKNWQTPLGTLHTRVFGDWAINLKGRDRAQAAALAASLPQAYTGEVQAYQIGIGIGTAGPVYGPTQGLVYGTTSQKNTWEARLYWQHIEQYALDVNLIDSDFFEGRANLQGFYTAVSYSITDAIIGTVRYGYANRINNHLGTGGNNLDIPVLNPIRDYNLVQLDLTMRF
jgi:polyhydroxyalkanoate synthesis regulator phasin